MVDSDSDNNAIDNESAEQSNETKIQQFQEITMIEDRVRAEDILSKFDFNLEAAIQEHLNQVEGRPSAYSPENADNVANRQNELRRRNVPTPQVANNTQQQAPRRNSGAVQRMGFFAWGFALASLPFRFVVTTVFDLLSFIYTAFFRRVPSVTDPVGDVRTFTQEFEQKYGTVHPKFSLESYGSALEIAKRDLHFMLVYLHSPVHQDSHNFCSNLLTNNDVINFIDQNLKFWAVSVSSPEGYKVSGVLRPTTYPFLAVICLREGRMSMVMRKEGLCSPQDLIALLAVAVTDNQPYIRLARRERDNRTADQLIRQQQEQQFAAALQEDKMREEKVKREEQRKMGEVTERNRKESIMIQFNQELDEMRARMIDELGSEPDADVEGVIRVGVKFASGARLERRFVGTDSLEKLFKLTVSSQHCPVDFSLMSTFPRKCIQCTPVWYCEFVNNGTGQALKSDDVIATFGDAGLEKSVMLIVQDNQA